MNTQKWVEIVPGVRMRVERGVVPWVCRADAGVSFNPRTNARHGCRL